MFFPHTTAGLTLLAPLNLRDELDRLMQACTNFQYQFGTPADAAVQVKAVLVDHSVPVPDVDGQLDLGWSPGIFVCESDEPRPRQIQVCPLVNA